jgi:hydroxymethylpyrimidine pyrophosphatase-like HAD family hydrolase
MKLVIDIDDTIWDSELQKDGTYIINKINTKIRKIISNLIRKGVIVIFYTARHWDKLEMTMEQLKQFNFEYTTLVMGKPTADYYIDDKNITPDEFIKLFSGGNL